MSNDFYTDVEPALTALRNGGVILYPTDTIWGLGCDATDAEAVRKIYSVKQRDDSKSLIVLMADEREVLRYVAAPDPAVFDFIAAQTKPTTIIFDNAVNLPHNVIAGDGSVAVRIVRDGFCRHLIKRLRKPVVSTSANVSGQPSPAFFDDVSEEIKNRVDHIVQWRQKEKTPAQPSQIIRWRGDGKHDVIRS